jgi:protein-disulfide isomerase
MENRSNSRLNAALGIVALIIFGALVYVIVQLTGRPDEARVNQLIEERLAQAPSAELPEEEFNARVERGIQAFIDKQQRAQADRPNQLAQSVPPPNMNDHLYGDPNAPITLIEYSDFECPFCKRFHATAKRLVDESNGQVNWVYRHFPLESHNPLAQKAAEASECAVELGGNEAFWRYTDTYFERTESGGSGFAIEGLAPLAGELGLDQAAFEKCLGSGKYADAVRQQMAGGVQAGITGTPGNILYHRPSGKVLAVHGAQPYQNLTEAVRALSAAQ